MTAIASLSWRFELQSWAQKRSIWPSTVTRTPSVSAGLATQAPAAITVARLAEDTERRRSVVNLHPIQPLPA